MLVCIHFDLYFRSSFYLLFWLYILFINFLSWNQFTQIHTHSLFINLKTFYKQPFKHHQERFLKKIFKLLLAYVINRKAKDYYDSRQNQYLFSIIANQSNIPTLQFNAFDVLHLHIWIYSHIYYYLN